MRTLAFPCLFLIFLSLGFFVLVSGQCLEDQKSILIQLKNSLQVRSPGKLVGWDRNSDCCSWNGVSCDVAGRVIGLDLANESISGGIESLFGLRNLESLNLSYNKFNSTIPSQLEQLASLKSLNFSNAGFKGQVPAQVSRLTRLVSLDFSSLFYNGFNNLQLEKPNLIDLVGNFSELEELYVDGIMNNITGNGSDLWSGLSSSLPKLRVLSLSNCYLSGPINSSLSKLKFLSVIRLNNNNLSAPVPEFFADFVNLTLLSLGNSGLLGEFPRKIFQVASLHTIDLSDNKNLQGSLPEFPDNGSLRTIKLSQTNFSGILPNSIGNLKMLSTIELASCNFSGLIPKSMEKLRELVHLDFMVNQFNGTIPSFSLSKNLTQMTLSHNSLSGQVPRDWGDFRNLVNLDLGNNALSGSIPESLFSLPLLQKIQLSKNSFSGKLIVRSVTVSHLLNTLDLSSNNLEGPIPDSVFDLRGLKILSLSSNNFSSPLNLNLIQQLKNLSVLDLSHNSLSIGYSNTDPTLSFPDITTLKLASCNLRTFPELLKKQSKLQYLDISMNQIQGNVPNWIWELPLVHLNLSFNLLNNLEGHARNVSPTLKVLDLHSNQLQGPIQIPPQSAAYLDYSSNNLSSAIPDEIGTFLSVAMFFSLSSNNFSGKIPATICSAVNLQVLDLSNNSLTGEIPKCLMALSGIIGVLNLRRNILNGVIHDNSMSNCLLKTLDLSENQLKGKVPKFLANCTMLEVLNLGNNQITDTFPCHLKNNSNSLRVLVLRANNFYGSIGCPDVKASWKNLQIVDLASNNFSGELPKKCLTTWDAMMIKEDSTEPELDRIKFSVLRLGNLYYQDAVRVTSKGLEMELVKILTVFTSIDLSCNKFVGPISETLGTFKALYALNLSHNELSGTIPSTLGNLLQLESLDLSDNKLKGEIPIELAELNFLSALNLSHNQLVGMIPKGTQLQSFSKSSFEGNKGLCGAPMSTQCSGSGSSPTSTDSKDSGAEFDWQFIYTGLGFGAGSAMVVAPIAFWRRGKKWCDNLVDQILLAVLPMVGLKYTIWHDREGDEEGDTEEDSSEDEDDGGGGDNYARGYGEREPKSEQFQGQYCVFCTKLDIGRKRAIHNLKCTCHYSPSITPFSSSSFSLSSYSS